MFLSGSLATTYTEEGFTLNAISPYLDINGFGRWATSDSLYAGSTALFHRVADGVIRLNQVGGGAFDLASIDLTEIMPFSSSTVNFTGTKADLSTVTQSFTTVPGNLKTFTFDSGFTNLTKVEWVGRGQVDNINVTATSAVPEPLTILGAMTATGFGAIFKRKLAQKKTDRKD